MWKLIFLGIAIYVIYRLFANDFLKKREEIKKREEEEAKRKEEVGEMVKDPECGTYVDVENSISVRDGQKIYYFCSYECRDKFLKRLESGGATLEHK